MTSDTATADRPETQTEPLRLSDAVALGFPHGGMTVSGLRREAVRGRLVIFKIAGKDFTTLADIEGMKELCRAEAKARVSGSSQPASEMTEQSSALSGSSATARSSGAQATARAMLEKLKRPSPTTSSPKRTGRGRATVTPLR